MSHKMRTTMACLAAILPMTHAQDIVVMIESTEEGPALYEKKKLFRRNENAYSCQRAVQLMFVAKYGQFTSMLRHVFRPDFYSVAAASPARVILCSLGPHTYKLCSGGVRGCNSRYQSSRSSVGQCILRANDVEQVEVNDH